MGCRRFFIIMFLFFSCLLLVHAVIDAFGVGCSYSLDSPLKMSKGEERIVPLSLENPDFEEGVVYEGKIIEGKDVAVLDNEKFSVPYKQGVLAKLTVRIPENFAFEKYKITYEFKQIPKGGESEGAGSIAISAGVKRSFEILIEEKKEKTDDFLEPKGKIKSSNVEKGLFFGIIIFIGFIILLIIVMIFLFIQSKNKK